MSIDMTAAMNITCYDGIVLNAFPPEPKCEAINQWLEGSASVVTRQVNNWIEAHHEYYRPALWELANKIKHIRHADFMGCLKFAVSSFNHELESLQDKEYTVLVQPSKSNQWVAELALRFLTDHPTRNFRSLGEKEARDFTSYLDRLHSYEDVPRRIVLFDDASYSGTQLTQHVKAIFAKFKDLELPAPTIHVVIACATPYAVRKLEALPQFSKGHLKLAVAGRIASIAKVLSSDSIQRLRELYDWSEDPGETKGRGIVWFDHKIPNGMSFVEPLMTGSVYPGRNGHEIAEISSTKYLNLPPIQPPYKG